MSLYGWTKQWVFDRKSWNMSKLVLLHSHKWMQQHLIYIFMIMIVILIMDMVIKKISKTHFCHQKWHNNVKKGKGKCENIDKKMKVYIIITVVRAIWVVLIVHQKHLTNNEKNIKHTLLMKMVIQIMAIWMLLILILLFSLLKQMEALMTSLIMRVLKK